MEDSKKQQWIKVVARNQGILHFSAMLRANHAGHTFGDIKFKILRQLIVKYNSPLAQGFNFSDGFLETNLKELIQKVDRNVNISFEKIDSLIKKNTSLSPGDNKEDCLIFYNSLKTSTGAMLAGIYFGQIIQEQLEKKMGSEWVEKNYHKIFHPKEDTSISRENQAIDKIRRDLKSGKIKKEELELMLKKIASDFGYIHSEYVAKEWDWLDYKKEVEREVGSKIETKEYEKIDLETAAELEEYIQWLIDLARSCSFYYDEGKAAVVRSSWALRQTLRKMGIDEKKMLKCIESEFMHWIDGGSLNIEDSVGDRENYYAVCAWNDGVREYLTKESVEKLIEKENITEFDSIDKVDTFSGLTAFPGKIRGIARIILTQKEQNRLKEGEILITSMTTPELIGVMRKASAFVTDEGGMLSHAAIVAREFQRPCVVGTKIATRIIKDGDLVEVDADHGVVRIIKKVKRNSIKGQ